VSIDDSLIRIVLMFHHLFHSALLRGLYLILTGIELNCSLWISYESWWRWWWSRVWEKIDENWESIFSYG